MAEMFALPFRPAFDSNGKSIPGAQAYFTLTGTNTPTSVFAEQSLTTPLSNPLVANGVGRFPRAYLDPAVTYRLRVYDNTAVVGVDTPIEEYDPYIGADGGFLSSYETAVAGGYAGTQEEWVAQIASVATTAASASTSADEAEASAAQAAADALAVAAALGAVGALAPVSRRPSPASFTLPVGFNDQLGGTKIAFNGIDWRFESSRYDKLDFTKTATSITHYYVDWTKSDSNDGLSAANAFKTFDKAGLAVAALAANSNVVIHLKEDRVGFLSGFNFNQSGFSGRHVKIIGEGPSGLSRLLCMREDWDQASFAWVAHGASGAWKTNTSPQAGNYAAQFWLGSLDADGIPTPIVSTGQSAATVSANELTSFWDGSFLYVHLPNGAKPDPFNNWLYCNNGGQRQFSMDNGTLLFENVDIFGGSVGGSFNALRFRSTSDAVTTSPARLGFKNVKTYGSSANGIGAYDMAVIVTEQCVGAYHFNDLFNIHSFRLTADWGEAMTYYEDNARGHHAGYTGFAWGIGASGSDNGSTVHDAASVLRVGSRFTDIKDCAFVDVNGCDSVNYGIAAPANGSGSANFYDSSICYEANTGEGNNRRMVLVGAAADFSSTAAAIQISGTAADAKIQIDRWYGDTNATLLVFDPNTGLAAGGTIRSLADNSQIAP